MENIELISIEFFVNNSNATKHNEYFMKNGKAYAIDDLTENQINILFQKFTYHPETRKVCRNFFAKTNSKILAVKEVIHKFFGELCGKQMDIDEHGALNVEHVCASKKQNNLYRNNADIGDIDEGCLWEMRGELFVLHDSDEYRTMDVPQWQHLFVQEK